jgi:hypothetical protein
MIELKVHCDCGQKFKFDVEPVNNQMPFTVACPICHRDGTGKANELLQQMAVFKPVSTTPPPLPTAPPPLAPAPPASTRIRMHVATPAQTGAVPAPPPIAPAAGAPPPPPIGARPRPGAAPAAAAVEPGKAPSFGLGILGGFIGALVGSLIYYVIFKTTGVRIFLAIGVGALAGWFANFLGRGEGSKELGGLVAVFVAGGCIAAQYFVLLGIWNAVVHTELDAGYTGSVTEAREVVKAVPTGSENEIRIYLAREAADEGEVAKPASVSADAVQEFRDKELPRYQDLASGKVTKEQYLAEMGTDPTKLKKLESEQGNTFKALFIANVLNLRSIISLALGVWLAFRFSTNARGG